MESLLGIQKTKEEMDYDIAKVNTWCEKRYLARGATRQTASAEIQQVTDLLIRGLGLRDKKKRSWFAEAFISMRSQNYRGIVGEFVGMVRESGKTVLS
jgi:dimethylaniline monooxygenase (N-oxide forming)